MKAVSSKKILATLIVLLVAILLTGCGTSLEKGRKPSVDWSRGLPLDDAANSVAGIAIDQHSDQIHIVWPSQDDSGNVYLRYVQLDQRAKIVVEREIARFSGQVRALQLVPGTEGATHLFWVEQVHNSKQWKLWFTQLDEQGEELMDPIQVSGDSSWVSDYAVAPDLDGSVALLWEDVDVGGFYFARISSQGEIIQEPFQLIEQGQAASLGVDSDGRIHLAWLEDGIFFYQNLVDVDAVPVDGIELTSIPMGTGDRVDGPVIGLADGWVYIFWSVLMQTGSEAGTAHTSYIAFPVGKPQESSIEERIGILPLEEQSYRPYQGVYNLTEWVPEGDIVRSSSFVYDPSYSNTYQSELALALAVSQNYRLDSYIQIAVAIFQSGQFGGYTFGGKTLDISGDAVLANDSHGNLHMVWRDGAAGNLIYYSTTAPEARERLDSLDFGDFSSLFLTGALEAITGVLLFPLALPWMLIGLVILVIWRLVRNEENLTHWSSRVLVAIAIISFELSKLLFMPIIFEYVPFSAWIDIPAAWQSIMRIATPVVILGIALLSAEWVRRKRTSSTLPYFFTVVVVDTVLTLSIYGVIFLGVY